MQDKYKANQLDKDEALISKYIRERVSELDMFIQQAIEDCDEKKTALMKLEEATMWSTKAVAIYGPKPLNPRNPLNPHRLYRPKESD